MIGIKKYLNQLTITLVLTSTWLSLLQCNLVLKENSYIVLKKGEIIIILQILYAIVTLLRKPIIDHPKVTLHVITPLLVSNEDRRGWMLEENTRLHPLFKSIWQFVPVEAVPMPREGKMGKVTGCHGIGYPGGPQRWQKARVGQKDDLFPTAGS